MRWGWYEYKKRMRLHPFFVLLSFYILDKTFKYEYNGIGNIDSLTTFAHVNGVASATGTTKTFTYDTANPDRLTSYNGKTCLITA